MYMHSVPHLIGYKPTHLLLSHPFTDSLEYACEELETDQHKVARGLYVASLPGFPTPEWEDVYMGRAWYLLSHDHDVIKIEPEFL